MLLKCASVKLVLSLNLKMEVIGSACAVGFLWDPEQSPAANTQIVQLISDSYVIL